MRSKVWAVYGNGWSPELAVNCSINYPAPVLGVVKVNCQAGAAQPARCKQITSAIASPWPQRLHLHLHLHLLAKRSGVLPPTDGQVCKLIFYCHLLFARSGVVAAAIAGRQFINQF